jgi:hypothetical protein
MKQRVEATNMTSRLADNVPIATAAEDVAPTAVRVAWSKL